MRCCSAPARRKPSPPDRPGGSDLSRASTSSAGAAWVSSPCSSWPPSVHRFSMACCARVPGRSRPRPPAEMVGTIPPRPPNRSSVLLLSPALLPRPRRARPAPAPGLMRHPDPQRPGRSPPLTAFLASRHPVKAFLLCRHGRTASPPPWYRARHRCDPAEAVAPPRRLPHRPAPSRHPPWNALCVRDRTTQPPPLSSAHLRLQPSPAPARRMALQRRRLLVLRPFLNDRREGGHPPRATSLRLIPSWGFPAATRPLRCRRTGCPRRPGCRFLRPSRPGTRRRWMTSRRSRSPSRLLSGPMALRLNHFKPTATSHVS